MSPFTLILSYLAPFHDLYEVEICVVLVPEDAA